MADEKEKTHVEVPLEWNVPDDLVARYATNMIVQRAENEFLLSFFEVKPPMLLGNQDEIIEHAKQIKSVRANCVAQIFIAADKMPSFIDALQKTLIKTIEHIDSDETHK